MKLTWLAPLRHRYHAIAFGRPIASSQTWDGAEAYLTLAVVGCWVYGEIMQGRVVDSQAQGRAA